MPVLTQTPFGSRWESDPRDQVAERNYAIMQQLAALNPARDVAQIEANARLQASEADARRSQEWARMQMEMQQRAIEAQERMAQQQAQQQQAAAESEMSRAMRLADYQDPVAPLLRQQLSALPTAGAQGGPQIDMRGLLEARGLPMAPAYSGLPLEPLQAEVQRTAAGVGPDVSAPYGSALPQTPLGWMAAAAFPVPAAGLAALRGIGNVLGGAQERPEELAAAARALRTFYEKSPTAGAPRGLDPASARTMAAMAVRKALEGRNLPPEQVEAIVAQAVAD